jgi:hypothetical protein
MEAYTLYMAKVAEFLGITKTRSIFEVIFNKIGNLIYINFFKKFKNRKH